MQRYTARVSGPPSIALIFRSTSCPCTTPTQRRLRRRPRRASAPASMRYALGNMGALRARQFCTIRLWACGSCGATVSWP
jgi:hypothetical protein